MLNAHMVWNKQKLTIIDYFKVTGLKKMPLAAHKFHDCLEKKSLGWKREMERVKWHQG